MKQFLMLFVHHSPAAFAGKKGPTTIEWVVHVMSMSSSLCAIAFSSSEWGFICFVSVEAEWIWKFAIFLKKSEVAKYIPGGVVEIQKYWNNTSCSWCVGSENVLHYAAWKWEHNSTAAVVVNFGYSLESCKTPTRFRQTQSEHNACIEAMYIISCQHISGRKSIWNNRSLEGFSILSSTEGSRSIWLYKCRGWPATTTTTHTANSTALFVFWKVSKSICTVV